MNRRKLTGFWNRVVMGFAVIVPLAALIYVTQVLPEFGVLIYLEQFLALFLSLCLTITFLTLPFRNALADDPGVPWYDVVLALVSLAIGLYVFFNYASILSSLGVVTTEKVVIGALGILLLFEATRRQVGWSMVLVGAVEEYRATYVDNAHGRRWTLGHVIEIGHSNTIMALEGY